MCVCVCQRQGLGRLRHIETPSLWVQQKVRTGAIELRKIRGDANPADMFTKFLPPRDEVDSLVRIFGCEYRKGRAERAPLLRRVSAPEVEHHIHVVYKFDPGLNDEAHMHDVGILPHQHTQELIKKRFPMARVGESIDEYLDYGREPGSSPEFHAPGVGGKEVRP